MNNTALELTPAEQELIEAKRARAQAELDSKAAELKVRQEKEAKIKAARDEEITGLKKALRDADDSNILFENKRGVMCFMLNLREETIAIEEHRSYGSGYRLTINGIKYRLRGWYNNHANRYYTNPKTVIKKIVEFQETSQAEANREKAKASASTIALKHLTEKYPNAAVTFEKGYGHTPDRIKVETDKGSYEFTYRIDEDPDVIETGVWKRTISKAIDEKVRTLILG